MTVFDCHLLTAHGFNQNGQLVTGIVEQRYNITIEILLLLAGCMQNGCQSQLKNQKVAL